MQLGGVGVWGGGGGFGEGMRDASVPWFCKKSVLILEKCALFVCIDGLNFQNAVLRASSIKSTKTFPFWELLLCVAQEKFIEIPLFQEISSVTKNSWLHA